MSPVDGRGGRVDHALQRGPQCARPGQHDRGFAVVDRLHVGERQYVVQRRDVGRGTGRQHRVVRVGLQVGDDGGRDRVDLLVHGDQGG